MRKKNRWLLSVILMLLLTSLACALPTGGDSEEPASVDGNGDTEPVEVIPEQPAIEDDGGNTDPDSLPGGGILNLGDSSLYLPPSNTNFYSSLDLSFTAPDVFGRITIEGATSVDPPPAFGYSFTLEGEAIVEGLDTLEIANIDGIDYVVIPGLGCISFGGDEMVDIFNDLVDSSELLEGEAQLVETGVIINGVPTNHYLIDETNIDTGEQGSEDYLEEIERGDLYVAVNGGYIIRVEIDGRGVSTSLSGDPTLVGDMHYELNFTPTSEAVIVPTPTGCEDAAETEFPVQDDAFDVSTIPGLYIYSTAYSFDNTVEFYKAEMAAAGWVLNEEIILDPLATLSFSLGARAIDVMILNLGEGAGIKVSIIEEL